MSSKLTANPVSEGPSRIRCGYANNAPARHCLGDRKEHDQFRVPSSSIGFGLMKEDMTELEVPTFSMDLAMDHGWAH
ncbi:NAC domain containing protein 36 [Actinidia rufa]|uniref:NAC domain containing protein 36 n=1 Tax=Actinidia rufa TaxID=165716 RepID=A0A7J0DP03_9ERIC|nr:NAC domain containing protein 36 [Actinidia rufa]